jgi:hypothetical protein
LACTVRQPVLGPRYAQRSPSDGRAALGNRFGSCRRPHRIWGATRADRSTQLAILLRPDPDRFNVYDDVRSKLVTAGVPTEEIAFIHDADTDSAKKLLFDVVNGGRVRVLLRSTENTGTGTDVPLRLVVLHHLETPPWRARDIEQRGPDSAPGQHQ